MKDYICFFLGHKYFVVQELTQDARRIGCKRCLKSFAMSDSAQSVLPWDSDFHKLYEGFGVEIRYAKFER